MLRPLGYGWTPVIPAIEVQGTFAVFQEQPLVNQSTGWTGYMTRTVLNASNLRAAPPKLQQNTTISSSRDVQHGKFGYSYFGHQGGADPWDFDGNQVQLTFGGQAAVNNFSSSTPFSIDGRSGAINYNFAKNLIISAHWSSTSVNLFKVPSANAMYYLLMGAGTTGVSVPGALTTDSLAETIVVQEVDMLP